MPENRPGNPEGIPQTEELDDASDASESVTHESAEEVAAQEQKEQNEQKITATELLDYLDKVREKMAEIMDNVPEKTDWDNQIFGVYLNQARSLTTLISAIEQHGFDDSMSEHYGAEFESALYLNEWYPSMSVSDASNIECFKALKDIQYYYDRGCFHILEWLKDDFGITSQPVLSRQPYNENLHDGYQSIPTADDSKVGGVQHVLSGNHTLVRGDKALYKARVSYYVKAAERSQPSPEIDLDAEIPPLPEELSDFAEYNNSILRRLNARRVPSAQTDHDQSYGEKHPEEFFPNLSKGEKIGTYIIQLMQIAFGNFNNQVGLISEYGTDDGKLGYLTNMKRYIPLAQGFVNECRESITAGILTNNYAEPDLFSDSPELQHELLTLLDIAEQEIRKIDELLSEKIDYSLINPAAGSDFDPQTMWNASGQNPLSVTTLDSTLIGKVAYVPWPGSKFGDEIDKAGVAVYRAATPEDNLPTTTSPAPGASSSPEKNAPAPAGTTPEATAKNPEALVEFPPIPENIADFKMYNDSLIARIEPMQAASKEALLSLIRESSALANQEAKDKFATEHSAEEKRGIIALRVERTLNSISEFAARAATISSAEEINAKTAVGSFGLELSYGLELLLKSMSSVERGEYAYMQENPDVFAGHENEQEQLQSLLAIGKQEIKAIEKSLFERFRYQIVDPQPGDDFSWETMDLFPGQDASRKFVATDDPALIGKVAEGLPSGAYTINGKLVGETKAYVKRYVKRTELFNPKY